MRIFQSITALTTAVCFAACSADAKAQEAQAVQANPVASPADTPQPIRIDARTWPRAYNVDGVEFQINQPQVDSWSGNTLKARTVMTVTTGDKGRSSSESDAAQSFGVLWLSARTETDKNAREVILDDLKIEKISFPAAKDQEARYLAAAQKALPNVALVASLDAIEASLALSLADADYDQKRVNNEPPEVIFTTVPAILVPIDGDPVWRPTGTNGVDHAVNSRAPILRYQGRYYFEHGGSWASSTSLTSGWERIATAPKPVSKTLAKLVTDEAGKPEVSSPESAAQEIANVQVRTGPAELLLIDGDPQFASVEGTSLSYVANTAADVFLDSENNWYVLISGRWFTSASTKGPWKFVDSRDLPADFSRIPSAGPKGAVLASIAGTPESKEALIANSIPQTATVNLKQASFSAQYDGQPQFEPIAETTLSAAVNSPTPVIRVDAQTYVALEKGVWFTANSANGPWAVATTVPKIVYDIPPSSRYHYVTYVRIYGSTRDEVFVGYTPGYYGTILANGVVVYGSGYPCNAWVGRTYYACPTTYGYGAAFAFGASVGWALTFGYGWYNPWYYPVWGPWYYPGYYPGYWGGAYFAHGNVYGHWGPAVVGGTRAAWVNTWTGNIGRAARGGYYNSATGGFGYGYGGRNTNIYTGNTVGAAGGIRYDPQTGRVVASRGGVAGNIYTGEGIAAGGRTSVDLDSGRVTRSAGVAARTEQGTTIAGGGKSQGPGGNASGAGYIHYDREAGSVSGAGVVKVGDDVYAGKDGNVYRYDGESWNQVTRPRSEDRPQVYGPELNTELNRDRSARDRGYERDSMSGRGFENQRIGRPAFDRGAYGGGYQGRMGGYRETGKFKRRF